MAGTAVAPSRDLSLWTRGGSQPRRALQASRCALPAAILYGHQSDSWTRSGAPGRRRRWRGSLVLARRRVNSRSHRGFRRSVVHRRCTSCGQRATALSHTPSNGSPGRAVGATSEHRHTRQPTRTPARTRPERARGDRVDSDVGRGVIVQRPVASQLDVAAPVVTSRAGSPSRLAQPGRPTSATHPRPIGLMAPRYSLRAARWHHSPIEVGRGQRPIVSSRLPVLRSTPRPATRRGPPQAPARAARRLDGYHRRGYRGARLGQRPWSWSAEGQSADVEVEPRVSRRAKG